jgi:hypothetical protein
MLDTQSCKKQKQQKGINYLIYNNSSVLFTRHPLYGCGSVLRFWRSAIAGCSTYSAWQEAVPGQFSILSS